MELLLPGDTTIVIIVFILQAQSSQQNKADGQPTHRETKLIPRMKLGCCPRTGAEAEPVVSESWGQVQCYSSRLATFSLGWLLPPRIYPLKPACFKAEGILEVLPWIFMGLFLLQQWKPASGEHRKLPQPKPVSWQWLSAWLCFSPFHISLITHDWACFIYVSKWSSFFSLML